MALLIFFSGTARAGFVATDSGVLGRRLVVQEVGSYWFVEQWFVEQGELVCESGPDAEYGYLATERVYRDFDLTLEFKQEADGNSGVFFRSSLDGTIISGWQAEVAPPGNNTGGIYESYGRGWLIQPDPTLPDVRMGEWNRMRVRVAGGRVTTWLNGVQMIDLEDEKIGAPEFVREMVSWGAGPRAVQFLILGGKARALLHGRTHVSTDDIQALAKPVLRHRLVVNFAAESDGVTQDDIVDKLLTTTPAKEDELTSDERFQKIFAS